MTVAAQIPVTGGPESLVVTASGATVYTNSFGGETVQIDAASRTETGRWSNGCTLSLGLAIDESASLAFVGCPEGKAVALSTDTGEVVSTADVAGGVDIIAYNQKLRHLYLNGSTNGVLTVVDVATDGALGVIATEPTAPSTDSSCVAADPYDDIWVCDANAGQLRRFSDVY
jgi:DNA-binding beta-propeller fold protein YncE